MNVLSIDIGGTDLCMIGNAYYLHAIWLVKRVAWLSPLEPGYRKSRVAPRLIGGLPSVKASY